MSFVTGASSPVSETIRLAGNRRGHRLVEIDALRGVAALAVVLFHYTTRFTQLFGVDSPPPTLSFAGGHYGVNLFFIISGFVIFMTLEKTTKPMDFVVSRFSRLFPAYWVAIVLTFLLTHLLGLPGKLVDLSAAFGNLMMIHGLFFIPHVDGVYWTLEVELLFYCGMLGLFWMRCLNRIHHVLIGLLAVQLISSLLASRFGIEISWTLSRLLILNYIPWFALGISIYLAVDQRGRGNASFVPALTASCAILTLLLSESVFKAALAVVFAGLVFLAASERLAILRHRPFVWLGAISYPLYLLHENIGWSVQLRLQALGMSTDATIAAALLTSLVLATGLHRWVEQPALRWIRSRYRRRLALAG